MIRDHHEICWCVECRTERECTFLIDDVVETWDSVDKNDPRFDWVEDLVDPDGT